MLRDTLQLVLGSPTLDLDHIPAGAADPAIAAAAFDAKVYAAMHDSDGAFGQLESVGELREIPFCPNHVHGHRLIGIDFDLRVAGQKVG